jgi:hypothetical protein
LPEQCALNRSIKKFVGKFSEGFAATQGKISGGETAARYRRDDIDFIEQRCFAALPIDCGIAQGLQNTIR